jgi:glycerol kinase
MQFLADVLAVPVVRPTVAETTCLGAAYAAGLAVGFWPDTETLRANWQPDAQWSPEMATAEVEREFGQWRKAVDRTLNWVQPSE